MKKLTVLITGLSLLLTTSIGQARENGIDGLILGAGGGALIGQAIGRNTEATLIGTAVGSMLGYIVGNEQDKNGITHRVLYKTPTRTYPRSRYVEVVPPPRYQRVEPICREVEMLAEIDGRAEKVYGTACLEDGEWVVNRPNQVSQTIIIEKNHHLTQRQAHYQRGNYRNRHRHDRRSFNHRPVW